MSNTFYKEQFDAVEQCFKVIGFTLEVQTTALTTGHKAESVKQQNLDPNIHTDMLSPSCIIYVMYESLRMTKWEDMQVFLSVSSQKIHT